MAARINLNGQQVIGGFSDARQAQQYLNAWRGRDPQAPGLSSAWVERRTAGTADEPGEWVRVRPTTDR